MSESIKTIAFFTQPGDLIQFNDFQNRFSKVFEGVSKEQIHWEHKQSSNEALDYLSNYSLPHVVVITATAKTQIEAARLVMGIRSLDKACVVIILTEPAPSSVEYMEWMDMGANAVLHFRFDPSNMEDVFRDLLKKRLGAFVSRNPRVDTTHKVVLRVASFEQALAAETWNVGTGGMFVRAIPQGAQVGDKIEFEVQMNREVSELSGSSVDEPLVKKLNEDSKGIDFHEGAFLGRGKIAWVRSVAIDGLPEGIGIAFEGLTSSEEEKLLKFISQKRSKSFIPLS